MLGLHLERLGEIVLAELDASFSAAPAQSLPYRGGIELKDIRFRYGDGEPYVLDGVDLTVEPGEHVAITGASGGGKSTLVKIILGLIAPETGQILIDGIDLNTFGHKNFHDYVGAVLQDDHLFAGSLAENIALFDDAPSMEAIHDAAKAAALHEDIIAMPMAYETMVGDMGSALSGGQRQRLLLARALYRHPRLIVMDEATSHLDPVREQAVVESISRLGITRIVIAHRLETILSASRVLALRQGKLEDVTAQFK